MKKKTKNLILLLSVMVLLLGGYLLMGLLPEKETEADTETNTEVIEITEFTVAEITSYQYKNPQYEIGFEVKDGNFIHLEDSNFPVNDATVELQLAILESLYASREISGTNKEEYGLANPQVSISVTLANGNVRNFSIGDKALFEDAYYVSDEENNKIYLVSSDQCAEFNNNWTAMVEKETMVTLTTDQIVDVTVETNGEITTYINYDANMTYPWQITTSEGTFAADETAMLEKLGMFGSYSVRSTVEYNCTDFAQYGLEPAKTKVTVRYTVPEGVEVPESAVTEELPVLTFEFGNVDEDNVSYVRVNGSSYVYGFSQYYADGLSVFDLEELRMKAEEKTAE